MAQQFIQLLHILQVAYRGKTRRIDVALSDERERGPASKITF
jgi:hypothetical protein